MPQDVTHPPRRRHSAPSEGTHTAVAGRSEGVDPGRSTYYSAKVVLGGGWQRPPTTKPCTTRCPMRDTMEAEHGTPELRVCCQPPNALHGDTRLHHVPVALLGVQAEVTARHAIGRPPTLAPGPSLDRAQGCGAHRCLAVKAADNGLLAVGRTSPALLGCGDYSGATVARDCCYCPSRRGQLKVSRGVCGAHVPRTPIQHAPFLLAPHGGEVAGRATPRLEDAPPRTPRRPGFASAARPTYQTPPTHVLVLKTEQGIWFHGLPAPATLCGTAVAGDAGTTPAGMAMAGVAQRGHEASGWAPPTKERLQCYTAQVAPAQKKWTPVKIVTKMWFSKCGLGRVEFDYCEACAHLGDC